MVELSVNRLSEQADIIPLMVSERLVDVHKDYRGLTMEAIGQFRSYNRHEGTKNRLMLSVFVREIHFMEEFTDYTKTNQIFLDGYICKAPIYRKTPLGLSLIHILCKTKKLTNTRSSSADEALKLTPPKIMSLEQCLDFIDTDEMCIRDRYGAEKRKSQYSI